MFFRRFEIKDFLVKLGSVTVGGVFKGILVEVEYCPGIVFGSYTLQPIHRWNIALASCPTTAGGFSSSLCRLVKGGKESLLGRCAFPISVNNSYMIPLPSNL